MVDISSGDEDQIALVEQIARGGRRRSRRSDVGGAEARAREGERAGEHLLEADVVVARDADIGDERLRDTEGVDRGLEVSAKREHGTGAASDEVKPLRCSLHGRLPILSISFAAMAGA